MRRFYAPDITAELKTAELSGDEFFHLKKVLRLKNGDQARLFNGKGLELTGSVGVVGKDFAVIEITGRAENNTESPVDVLLILGIVKGSKPEFVIQKATELGVRKVGFYNAKRSVPNASVDKVKEKLSRWQKVAISAVKQCGRAIVPDVCFEESLNAHLRGTDGFAKLILWEGEANVAIKEVLKNAACKKGVVLLAGPEGGFDGSEVAGAISLGFTSVSLGPRILRAETAVVASVAITMYELGAMG